LNQLRERYHGDLQKALAAYNWGPTNVDSVSKTYGKDWKSHLPVETRGYIAATQGSNVTITINNNTGGAATVVASQLAH
jgi:soluble lytic murein transglycosylase-like protein